jgi:3-oxoadipate enol-lactonase
LTGDFFIKIDGLSFHGRIDGPDRTVPWLIFSNSILTNLHEWDAQVDELSHDYRILRYDQRGHGKTDIPRAPTNFAELGGDLIALLDHAGIKRATLIGHSMGSPTVLEAFSRDPERVERIIIVAGQAATAVNGAKTWQERIDFARQSGMDAVADVTLARWFAPDFIAAGGAENVRRMIASTAIEGFAACATALQSYAYGRVIEKISVPALLIAGASDGAMPQTMAKLAEAMPNARLVQIPGAGHIPNVDRPKEVTAAIRAFLEETN